MENRLDKQSELEQWQMRWENEGCSPVHALAILQQLNNYPPAEDLIEEVSRYLLNMEDLNPVLLYELFSWHHERQNTETLNHLASLWKKVSPQKQEDFHAYLSYLRDIRDEEHFFSLLLTTQKKGFDDDQFFFLHLEMLIDLKNVDKVLDLLTVQKCKDLKDPECYLIRAKILSQSSARTTTLCNEVEYLCLEALRLDPCLIDAFMLLLEWYTLVFKSKSKIIFLFKWAQSHQIKHKALYQEILTALMLVHETTEAVQVYDVIKEYCSVQEKVLLKYVQTLHTRLYLQGLSRPIWMELKQRGAMDNPLFLQKVIDSCLRLQKEDLLWRNEENLSPGEDWQKALLLETKNDKEIVQETMLCCLDLLIEANPDISWPYESKAKILSRGKPEQSLNYFCKAMEKSPTSLSAHFHWASQLFKMERYLESFEAFELLLQHKERDPYFFTESCLQLFQIGRILGWKEKAVYFLEKALPVSPYDHRIHQALSITWLEEYENVTREDGLEKAEFHLKKISQISNPPSDLFFIAGKIAFFKGKWQEAIQHFNSALAAQPSQPNVLLYLSRSCYQMHGLFPSSREDYLGQAKAFLEKIVTNSEKAQYLKEDLESFFLEKSRESQWQKRRQAHLRSILQRLGSKAPNPSSVAGAMMCFASEVSETGFLQIREGVIQAGAVKGSGQLNVMGHAPDFLNLLTSQVNAFSQQALEFLGRELAAKDKDLFLEIPPHFKALQDPSIGSSLALAQLSALLGRAIPQNILTIGEISLHGDMISASAVKSKLDKAMSKQIALVIVPRGASWDCMERMLEEGVSSDGPWVIPLPHLMDLVREIFS